ncbi:MAG: amino acid adenylation domain-containing protein, partial [Deltaproteobacteria bacterium]|nr:amino acid adenylation domain-containing protein [Deltaproteobacteria bacterium]
LQPESPAYNIVQGIRIQGKLDCEIFRQALAAIVMRHETLRMRFVSAEGRPKALIAAAAGPAVELIDAVKSTVREAEAEVRSIVRREAVKTFDLEKGPLYRGLLFKTGDDDYVFLFIFHHIIADGWSMGVWLQELSVLYEACAAGGRSVLPELAIQYTDYAAWQRTWIENKDFSADIAFWKQRLGGKLPVLQMPADYPRPEDPHNDGALESFVIPESLVRLLADYAQKESCTLFMMLLAGFMTLLQRYTGQETVIIGSPYANRDMVECERLIGFFLNMLPLRGDLNPDMPFNELLHQVRESTLEAYAHHELPFGTLVDAIQPERSLNHHPVFQVMFAFQNFPLSCKSTAGIYFQPLFFDRGATEYDLALYMWEEGGGLCGAFEYSTELFRPETIARLAGHFMTLLGGIAQEPSQKLQAIPLLTQQELASFAAGWKAAGAAYPGDATAAELFEAQVERAGDLPAVMYKDVTVTYRELNRRANQLARILQNGGVGPDVLVGVYLERSIDMVVAVLGIHKAGGAYVPLDPAFPRDRLEFMMEDSGLHVLLTQESLAPEVPAACPARVIVLDRDRDEIGRQSGENMGKTAGGGNLAYVIYTSGSTGKPKGVEIEQRALVNFLLSMQREPGLAQQDVLLSVTTLSFDIAGLELFLPLITGARVVLAGRDEAIDGFRLKQMLQDFRATVMQATPATWKMLLEAGLQEARGLKVLCGGEALSGELAGRILETGAELWNMYGPTETTIWSSVCRVEDGGKAPDIGHPIANTQFYILDELQALVPIGVAGELYIGGDGLARGYLNRPELTAERFPPDPFAGKPGSRMYRTGDLVRRMADGRIEFLGRTDHQVKIRGYRIELGEIESAIGRYPAVKEAVVVAREDEPDNKRLVAYIIEEPGMPLDRGELREHVQHSLPDYMTPSFFVMLESFPLTPNGKIDRKALPQPDMQADREEYSFVAPRDQLEIQLASIWQKMLGVKSISIKDNYFDLGGNSLMATRLFAQIEKSTGKTIPLATLFRAPTIEQIAGILREKDWKPSWSSLIPIQPGGTKPPLFLVHGAGGNVLLYRPLAQRLGPDQPVYGLQAQGLDGAEPFYTRIEDMAAHYIEEIKKFQPEGPYYLGGYCMGGAIAYEMACQLERQGDRAAIVAMFDTFNGWRPETFFSSIIHQYQRIAFHAKNVLMIQGPGRRAFLKQKAMEAQRRAVLTASVAASRIARRLGLRKENPPVILDEVNDAAVIQYRPGRYAGRITVFAPCDAYAGYEDPQLGWGGMASGGVDIIGLKAYPAGMLVDPFVVELAGKLQACLEGARTTQGSAQAG